MEFLNAIFWPAVMFYLGFHWGAIREAGRAARNSERQSNAHKLDIRSNPYIPDHTMLIQRPDGSFLSMKVRADL